MNKGAIGVFDSGFGGLTVLKELTRVLPQNDFLYLGDNARTPYGSRSFETIYEYTLECVQYLLEQDCPLVILACNTASAKALRTIQQKDLPKIDPHRRVLGVIRPTAEVITQYSNTKHVGILGTAGTIQSESYLLEIEKQSPGLRIFQQACPMWVPLIENGEANDPGSDYFVKKYLNSLFSQSNKIDTLLLACTHYPMLVNKIKAHIPEEVKVLNQGEIVAPSLANYLYRHPEIARHCTKNAERIFQTTDSPTNFDQQAESFFGEKVDSQFVHI